MPYKRLLIWVEGDDDVRFFDKIVKPILEENYDLVEIRAYGGDAYKNRKTQEFIENYIRSMRSITASAYQYDYIFATDLNSANGVEAKKDIIQNHLSNINKNCIQVVIQEIESWYLAGLEEECCRELNIPLVRNTDNTTKEDFISVIPDGFTSKINFMIEIIKLFKIGIAQRKNQSFEYFCTNYL